MTAAPGDAAGAAAGQTVTISNTRALVLLAWIEAIKATGGTLAGVSLVDASQAMDLSAGMRSAAAGAVSLAIAATAVAAGVAADRLGRRPLLVASFVLAGAANLAIFLFPTGWVYLGGLVVAGLGYSVMLTSSYAYTKAVAPGRSLGMGLGLVGMFTTVIVMATSLGGGALAAVGWRWLFLVVPVMCAVALPLTPRLLPPMPRTGGGRVDVAGLALLGAGMVAVIMGASRVTAHPPERSGWLFLLGGAALFAVWVVVERHVAAPSFPVHIFRSRAFVAAVIVGLACPIALSAMALGINAGTQFLRDTSTLFTTLALEPLYIAGGIGGIVAGRLLARPGAERRVMTLSPLAATIGFAALAPLPVGLDSWKYLPFIVLIGAGVGATLTAQGQVIIRAVEEKDYGAVTSSRTTVGQLGSALGMVLTMLAVKLVAGVDLWKDLKAAGVTEADVLSTTASIENGAPPETFPDGLKMILHSLGIGLDGAMIGGACLMGTATLLVWVLLRRRGERPPSG